MLSLSLSKSKSKVVVWLKVKVKELEYDFIHGQIHFIAFATWIFFVRFCIVQCFGLESFGKTCEPYCNPFILLFSSWT